jgi:hypothetical protein
MGQPLPFFACMEMSQDGPDGKPVLPLFMAYADCAAALELARESTDEKLEIVGLSLPSVVERLSSLPSEDAGQSFTFVPPAASAAYIQAYLGTQAP